MYWDDLVRRLRREVGAVSPDLLSEAGGNVAVVRVPRRRRRARWPLLVLALLAVAAVLLFGSGRLAGSSETTSIPGPSEPVSTRSV
jgi:type VI protein secretion system component VasF